MDLVIGGYIHQCQCPDSWLVLIIWGLVCYWLINPVIRGYIHQCQCLDSWLVLIIWGLVCYWLINPVIRGYIHQCQCLDSWLARIIWGLVVFFWRYAMTTSKRKMAVIMGLPSDVHDRHLRHFAPFWHIIPRHFTPLRALRQNVQWRQKNIRDWHVIGWWI